MERPNCGTTMESRGDTWLCRTCNQIFPRENFDEDGSLI